MLTGHLDPVTVEPFMRFLRPVIVVSLLVATLLVPAAAPAAALGHRSASHESSNMGTGATESHDRALAMCSAPSTGFARVSGSTPERLPGAIRSAASVFGCAAGIAVRPSCRATSSRVALYDLLRVYRI